MKIQIASDLHLNPYNTRERFPVKSAFHPVVDRDLLILAGDIGVGDFARPFVEQSMDISPVIYVSGNHEYYGIHIRRAEVDAVGSNSRRSTTTCTILSPKVLRLMVSASGEPLGTQIFGVRTEWTEKRHGI